MYLPTVSWAGLDLIFRLLMPSTAFFFLRVGKSEKPSLLLGTTLAGARLRIFNRLCCMPRSSNSTSPFLHLI